MTVVLLFAAMRGFDSSVALIPYTPDARTIRASKRCLGAAKKKKRVRRTEGRTGLHAAARTAANGKAAFRNRDLHAVRHKTCRRSARRDFRFANCNATMV